ncbi:putative oocyte-secreted protein 1 homolog [Acinonyx jubatus]|uniref:Oocyte-secreted protein 1 homolog n=1 Tax=Acinonyx jubatus TaxID=32536 RepID=A0ABM3NI59_ACIJB|nr:putative oocyte-secreted protein 1 homolog [Acinonyx jubatus]
MKTFLGLRSLLLLFCMIWTCVGDWSAVQVYCTNFWFYAEIKPMIFHNMYMNPDKTLLGDDCLVTHTWGPYHNIYYEFFYHPYDCGIITKEEWLLLKTRVSYGSSTAP